MAQSGIVAEAIRDGVLNERSTLTETLLHCTVCGCDIKGAIPAESHLKGSKHMIKCARRHSSFSSGCDIGVSSSTFSTPIKNEASSIDAHLAASPFSPSPLSPSQTDDSIDIVKNAVSSGVLTLESSTLVELYNCIFCKVSVTGAIPAKAHILGKPHQKAVQRTGLMNVGDVPGSSSSELKVDLDNSEVEEALYSGVLVMRHEAQGVGMECTVCPGGGLMYGLATALSHLSGKQHNKMIKTRRLLGDTKVPAAPILTSVPDILSPSVTLAKSPDPEVASALANNIVRLSHRQSLGVAAQRYECLVCQVAVIGEMNLSEHIHGSGHVSTLNKLVTKTLPRADDVQSEPVYSSPPAVVDDYTALIIAVEDKTVVVDDHRYRCKVCNISCTCDTDMILHLDSMRHLSLTCKESLEDSHSGSPTSSVGETYTCALCQVSASCSQGLQQHLNGDKHRKKAALRVPSVGRTAKEVSDSSDGEVDSPADCDKIPDKVSSSHVSACDADAIIYVAAGEPIPTLNF